MKFNAKNISVFAILLFILQFLLQHPNSVIQIGDWRIKLFDIALVIGVGIGANYIAKLVLSGKSDYIGAGALGKQLVEELMQGNINTLGSLMQVHSTAVHQNEVLYPMGSMISNPSNKLRISENMQRVSRVSRVWRLLLWILIVASLAAAGAFFFGGLKT